MTTDLHRSAAPAFLAGGGEMGERIRAYDWAASPLGPPETWPQALRTLVELMLCSRQAMFVAWGPQRIMIYNDGYAPLCGSRHPWALGQPFDMVWHDILDTVGPIMDRAYAGISTHMDDIAFTMHRHGYPEAAHFSFSYTPVHDKNGDVAGMFCACDETTQKVFAERRQHFLIDLADRLRGLADPKAVLEVAAEALGRHLGATRVGYAETDDAAEHLDVQVDWTDGGVRSAVGHVPITAFGADIVAAYRAGQPWVVQDAESDPRPSVRRAAADYLAWDSRAVIGVPLVKAGRWIAVLFVHGATARIWTASEIELAQEVAERTWAALETARSQRSLRESEARFRNLADHAPVMIWVTDATGFSTYLNRRWYEFTGQTEAQALGYGWIEALHPDDRAGAERAFLDSNTAEESIQIEYRLRRADGTYRWALDTASPRHGPNGEFLGYVGSVIDIDERRETEQRQALLAREVDHRARNALAVVLTVVRLTRADQPEDFQNAVEGRVAALARAHGLLAKSRWTGGDLREIVAEELDPYLGERTDRAGLSGPPVLLAPDAVQPVAMVLHELATNAAKHGALSTPDGRIDVAWGHEDEGGIWLDWRETGGPPVTGQPSRRGFGSQMIRAAAAQLGGTATFHWEPAGLHCLLTLAPDTVNIWQTAGQDSPNAEAGTAETIPLTGCRVLVVEDDALLALEIEQILESLGCHVIGPAGTLGEALRLAIDAPTLHAAVLDVNLKGKEVWPAVDILAQRGIPHLFTTGYGQQIESRGAPVLEKPIGIDRLTAALKGLLGTHRPA